MATYLPPNSTLEDALAALRQVNIPNTPTGTKLPQITQATVPGINLQTGMPLGGSSADVVLPGQQMNLGPQVYQAPGNTQIIQPSGTSASDAFFSSARAPLQTRTLTSPTMSAVTGGSGSSLVRTGGNGGSASSASSLNTLIAALTGGANSANAANEARYNEALATLGNYGKGAQSQLASNYKQDVASQEQQAVSRGLGNSTIRNALIGGARARQQQAALDLGDRLAAAKVNLLQSRNDVSADPLALVQLIQQAAQYGGANSLGSIASALGVTNRK